MVHGFRPKLPKTDRTPTSYSPSAGPPLPHHRQKTFTDRPLVYLSDGRTRHSRKRENQTTRWLQNIIPLLIPIYIELVQKTTTCGLWTPYSPSSRCAPAPRRFLLDELTIRLLRRGFFPCAPLEPTLAVDLRVLEFVMGLFLNMPPNNTALTKTLETYLDSMGYKLDNRVCLLDALRRRFGNALEWYTSMRHRTTEKIDGIISLARDLLPQNCAPPAPPAHTPAPRPRTEAPPSTPSTPRPSVPPPQSPLKRRRSSPAATPPPDSSPPASPTKRRPACQSSPSASPPASPSPPSSPTNSSHDYPFSEPEDRSRPSDYLRARCPACFGGKWEDPEMILAVIMSGDACFTQRRNKGKGRTDPPHRHPTTVFVPEEVTKQMESFVDSVRPPQKPARKPRKATPADEKRMKSSTQFFDDTGLMGLNCRHDHLLFLVNMKTAGEKQFNMYALLYMFLLHLPRWFVVGFLYDIACQLERSARLWGFLPPEMLARLQFAVSVLHAFGHHWVCQMLFFGLSDGEGCERFWHSISKLIGYLRVCGTWAHTQEKRREATEALEEPNPFRVSHDTRRPVCRVRADTSSERTRNAGKIAIEEVLRLRKVWVVLRARVRGCEEAILDPTADLADIEIATQDLQIATAKLRKHEATLRAKEAALGVADKQMLRHLLKSEYIRCRMNARALKYRIREKLRGRKFELERVDQFVHRKKATDPKLKTHIEDAVKRRDPGIQELVRNYNKLCAQMASLIKRKKAPKNAMAPEPIDPKSIWGLDVDDEIWQDVGLDDAYDDQEPPLWLKDEAVRTGIKAMLELDRCLEEEPRVFHECRALRWWLSEEWDAVTSAKAVAAEDGVVHQLKLRQQDLTQLCATWKAAIRPIPFKTEGLPAWGPSEEELMAVRIEDVVSKTTKAYDDDTTTRLQKKTTTMICRLKRSKHSNEGRRDVHDDWGTWTDDDTWFST
ncbi:hypothetical protein B0H13DRAFT_2241700 [Mycena leptocephala]|nr:hypothetical protein B0H13DRAFT_2241700 [Mycena leptocephala]